MNLEVLEDITLPSSSAMNPLSVVSVASPPPVPSVSAITSYVEATMNQWTQLVATVQQDISNALYVFGQEIAQEASAVEQQWEHLLGITPAASNPSLSSTVAQPSSSGAGQGHASGSGSGSGATTTAHDNPHSRLDARADVSGSGGGSAYPTYSGSATVYGQVWLDNNGDASIDNNEMDYAGATVDLFASSNSGATWSFAGSDITSNATQGNNYSIQARFQWPNSNIYRIQVLFPSGFEATKAGGASQITAQGYSSAFGLPPGAAQKIIAGLASMTVNTTDDDMSGPLPADQNKVTLRDAMETGNNGGGILGLTQVNFTGNGASGTIQLGGDLPHIERSYNINGPGTDALTVNGSGWQTFFLESNFVSTISTLTIKGGYTEVGGGVYSSGNLTLDSDNITSNMSGSSGGGVANGVGGVMVIKYSTISNNTTGGSGGGVVNFGQLTIYASQIYSNKANVSGGGLGNGPAGKAKVLDASSIYNNTAVEDGGGIDNIGSSVTVTSASIRGNVATVAGGGRGGGIFSNNGSLTLTMDDKITNNTAERGGGIFQGGGIAKMSGGAISSNKATADDAVAVGGGGGIFDSVGSLHLTGVLVSLNKVSGDNGAGLYIGKGTTGGVGFVTVSGGTFQFNSSANNGGGIYNAAGALTLQGKAYFGPDNSAVQGGGMYLANGSDTTFNGATVSGNTASNGGVGVYQQKDANVAEKPILTDKDDPGGVPFQGP